MGHMLDEETILNYERLPIVSETEILSGLLCSELRIPVLLWGDGIWVTSVDPRSH